MSRHRRGSLTKTTRRVLQATSPSNFLEVFSIGIARKGVFGGELTIDFGFSDRLRLEDENEAAKTGRKSNFLRLERETGFEPATSTLARSHSTAELLPLSIQHSKHLLPIRSRDGQEHLLGGSRFLLRSLDYKLARSFSREWETRLENSSPAAC